MYVVLLVKFLVFSGSGFNFCRAMRCISAAYVGIRGVCLSVYLSVTFVDHVKTNKHNFEIFFTFG